MAPGVWTIQLVLVVLEHNMRKDFFCLFVCRPPSLPLQKSGDFLQYRLRCIRQHTAQKFTAHFSHYHFPSSDAVDLGPDSRHIVPLTQFNPSPNLAQIGATTYERVSRKAAY